MDPALTNYLGLLARCHAMNGRGALFFDPQNTRVRWVPESEIEPSVQKEIAKEIRDPEIPILMQADDGMIHVAKAVHPVIPINKRLSREKITLIINVDKEEELSPLTRLCIERFEYPQNLLEWKFGTFSRTNDVVESSSGDLIMHIENGEYYFPHCVDYLKHELDKGFSCVGTLSAIVYHPSSKTSYLSFDDHLGISAMKWGAMMYTREFWNDRGWKREPESKVITFLQGREHQCSCISPIEVMCFVEKSPIDYLQPIPNILTESQQDLVSVLIN